MVPLTSLERSAGVETVRGVPTGSKGSTAVSMEHEGIPARSAALVPIGEGGGLDPIFDGSLCVLGAKYARNGESAQIKLNTHISLRCYHGSLH